MYAIRSYYVGQEDHVSMGSISGRKLLQVIDNVERIIGLEFFCAAQALDFLEPLRPTPILDGIHQKIREQVPHITQDELINHYMHHTIELVKKGELLRVAHAISTRDKVPFQTSLSKFFDEF